MLNQWLHEEIDDIAAAVLTINRPDPEERPVGGYGLKRRVENFLELVRAGMYPEVYAPRRVNESFLQAIVRDYLQQASIMLCEICDDVLSDEGEAEKNDHIASVASEFMNSLPEISKMLRSDIRAAYLGDPAAKSEQEILLAYPAFEAISTYRLAHRLYELRVPLLPRMMTECAHQRTGIDIHPGATIGESFFIDHGTGVVIGETCVIGDRVKLYQGVTLGAKSFDLDREGNPVKGIKRHPQIGSNVVIYAGATILGGDTVIGDNCVIGSNVWLTGSVPAESFIYYDANLSTCRR